jgi:hypothetical protein
VPPQEPEYQYQLAPVPKDPPETLNVDELPKHIEAGEADADDGAVERVPVRLQLPFVFA